MALPVGDPASMAFSLLQPTLQTALFQPLQAILALLPIPFLENSLSLLVVGFLMELLRRVIWRIRFKMQYETHIESHHSAPEASHDWLLAFWTTHESWIRTARVFDFQIKVYSSDEQGFSGHGYSDPYRGRKGTAGKAKFKPARVPRHRNAHFIRFKGYWVKFERREAVNSHSMPSIVITIRSHSFDVLDALIVEAKRAYEAQNQGLLNVKTLWDSGSNIGWIQACTRYQRALSSVIVEDGVADKLLQDVSNVLSDQQWYLQRGIPWRRGYLLYGAPGTGKTSTIQAIASELGLDVYMLSLSSEGLNDSKLLSAMTSVYVLKTRHRQDRTTELEAARCSPHGSIVVMEDIDASSNKREPEPSREKKPRSEGTGASESISKTQPPPNGTGWSGRPDMRPPAKASVTLSGLLNAIVSMVVSHLGRPVLMMAQDGIAGSEGRLLFMTTNYRNKLDTALIRPGRADVQFKYTFATSRMIGDLFCLFYRAKPADSNQVNRSKETPTKTEELIVLEAKMNKIARNRAPLAWEEEAVAAWRDRWVSLVPERRFSIAQLQGLLMLHKTDPEAATPAWVAETLATMAAEEKETERSHAALL